MRYEVYDLEVPGQQSGPAVLTAYLLDAVSAAPDKKRPAVIVVPGGGYNRCSDREKEPVAMQFLAMGYHAFLLDYSVDPHRFPVSLTELALAVATLRKHAQEWRVDPDAILVCGFSAGGHLACSLGTFWNDPVSYRAIGKTPEQVRPDGLILCYPVITSGEFRHPGSIEMLLGEAAAEPKEQSSPSDRELLEKVSLERQVSTGMPPVFLWHTLTDQTVPVENSLLLAAALRRCNVSFELHIFPTGCHGLALANKETGGNQERLIEPCCQTWISLVKSWIENTIEFGGQTLVKYNGRN